MVRNIYRSTGSCRNSVWPLYRCCWRSSFPASTVVQLGRSGSSPFHITYTPWGCWDKAPCTDPVLKPQLAPVHRGCWCWLSPSRYIHLQCTRVLVKMLAETWMNWNPASYCDSLTCMLSILSVPRSVDFSNISIIRDVQLNTSDSKAR